MILATSGDVVCVGEATDGAEAIRVGDDIKSFLSRLIPAMSQHENAGYLRMTRALLLHVIQCVT